MRKACALTIVFSTFLFLPRTARALDGLWIGADYGGPVRLSAEATQFLGMDYNPVWGFVGSANAGLGGVKIGAGIFAAGDMFERSGPSYEFWPTMWHHVSLKAVFVHTWGAPLGVEPGVGLAGGEIEYSVMSMLSAHVGILFPVSGSHSGDSHVLSWGVGLRFPH